MSRFSLYLVVLLLTICCASARTSKAEKFWKQAQSAEEQKDYERAADLYSQAARLDPGNPSYAMGERRVRVQASQLHIKAGQEAREKGQLEAAVSEFQRAFTLDPSNLLAVEEKQRTQEMILRNKSGKVPADEANLSAAQIEQKREARKFESMLPAPELKPILNRIATLKMNNQPVKVLYETVSKLAGVNVIFDPQLQQSQHNANVDINNATLQEALDYIGLITKTYWKPVTGNTIFITDDTTAKRHDYEDQVLKVFYLRNMTTVQEFQEVVNAVRSATDIRRMFVDNAQYAVIARGTCDQVALAAKLFHDLDRQRAEVLVDIVVMEVNSSRTKTLASGLVTSSGGAGLGLPLTFTPRSSISTTPASSSSSSSTTTSSTISVGQIGKVGFSDFSISLPGALLEAIMSDSTTHILQSPQVRASDGQKVVLKIGDKVPYATGSYQTGTVGTSTVSPLVSTQFNFAEVGVNVELTPHVHGDGEVSMHVSVEISSVSKYVDIGGISQPVISQRKDDADVRMRSGEVNLLGGLTQLQNTKTLSGIPGLVNIPILGKALSSNNATDREQGELMIALIPHVLRTSDVPASALDEVAAGTEQVIKVNYAPEEVAPEAPPTVHVSERAFEPSAITTHPGGKFDIILHSKIEASPFNLTWDPALLRLEKITPADQTSKFDVSIRNDTGEAVISGQPQSFLATLTFVAIGNGTCKVGTASGPPVTVTISSQP